MKRALPALAVLSSLLLAPVVHAADDGWEEASRSGRLTVYNRAREGSDVKEVRAIGIVDAAPWILMNAIADTARYQEFMPFTKESRVVKSGPGWTLSYQRLNPPLVDQRDYTIRLEDKSRRLPDGKIIYKQVWKQANNLGPAPIDGVVRVQVNEGSWQLEELDGGKRTRITYYVYTTPGGAVPSFLINAANNKAVPDLFDAVEKAAKDARYQVAPPKLVDEPAAAAPMTPGIQAPPTK